MGSAGTHSTNRANLEQCAIPVCDREFVLGGLIMVQPACICTDLGMTLTCRLVSG